MHLRSCLGWHCLVCNFSADFSATTLRIVIALPEPLLGGHKFRISTLRLTDGSDRLDN